MKDGFYSSKSAFGAPNALVLLMVIFFFVPFAARGARMALQKTENNVKDWLPSDFRETEELAWFAKRFVSEQFVVATWENCTEDSQRLKMFVSKLRSEQDPQPDEVDPSSDYFRARQLGAEYGLFVGDNDHSNWGGKEEKWLVDETGKSFYITPNGRLYRWDGSPNLVGAIVRGVMRAVGSFRLDGQFVAAFGDPSTAENTNPFWSDPRLLSAPLFKSVETGPDLVDRLTSENGSLATPSEPTAGRRMAKGRLTGTLFGPPVPGNFSWQHEDLEKVIPEDKYKELPEGWRETWDTVVQQAVQEDYGGDLSALREADPVDQATLWYEFFDAVALPEPKRQTCAVLTLTDVARRNLAQVIGRGILGQPRGRVFEVAEQCGISTPPKPPMAPPPFSWLAANDPVSEPVIRLGGPPVDNVAIDEEGTITLVRLIGYSLALGLGLSYLLLRSIRLMLMVFFVGGVAAMTSLGLVWWGNASVDAILLTMPSLVYVLGMAGAIHIVNYYRDATLNGGQRGAPERAISHAVMPCTLAAVTTAIGLLSLCSSNILPIRKFGLFSAMGVMTTLVLLYLFLPSALTIFPPRLKAIKEGGERATKGILSFWEAIGRFILKRHWWVNAVCLIAFVGLGVGLTKIQTSVQLLKLFDSESQIIQDYRWLESNFGRLVPMELVVRFPESMQRPYDQRQLESVDELRRARTQLSMLERADAVARIQGVLQNEFGYGGSNVVGRGMSPITFLRDMPDPWRGFNPQRSAFNRILEQSRDELLESDYLAVERDGPAEGTELWRISLRLGALNDVDYGRFVSSLRAAVGPVVAGYRCRGEILETILQQHPGVADGIRGEVLILGHGRPNAPGESADGGQGQTENELRDAADRIASSHSKPIDDVQLMADTLSSCLVNETIRRTRWHDPHSFPLKDDPQTRDKWGEYLKQFHCVVLLDGHPDYDLDFIREKNPHFVNAQDMLEEVQAEGREPRVATGQPVELSTRPGEMDVVYTGIVPVVYKAQRTLLESLIQSVGMAFGLIAVIMVCLLSPARSLLDAFRPVMMVRAIGSGALSMIPNVFPVVIIFGIMGHAGSLVDIGSMMTASVAMGVAVDDTIHFLTWFRNGLRRGLDRREAIFVAYKHVAPAMTQTTIIAGLGLSVFALSTFTPTQRFGTLMLALLGAALVGDLIFLPALLASPLGRIFAIGTGKNRSDGDDRGGQATSERATDPSTSTDLVADADEYRLQPEDQIRNGSRHDSTAPPGVKAPHMWRSDQGSRARRRS